MRRPTHHRVQARCRTLPITYNVLAEATGHWEWESTGYQSGLRTPATQGFTRQVVFATEGQLTVRRNGQPYYQTTFQLSQGPAGPCVGPNDPLITFTSEADLSNSDAKIYRLSQQNGQRQLQLVGAGACFDAGASETYHWIAE
ncbi:hypothetical protein [Hymenobacter nivis]|uniref:Lipocalin-like domain-containing protein n=1 Tax=Hymenobacter nivis TaxID=1850093 RepID=A0A2Z3GFK8_9BACT|nr:hypothetical protein [Hymenobacter nivis]AWM32343.1 hypothetical protein DDQ68_05770 [Hymenobacter nivis]